jgi:hypothetical protein
MREMRFISVSTWLEPFFETGSEALFLPALPGRAFSPDSSSLLAAWKYFSPSSPFKSLMKKIIQRNKQMSSK